MNPYISFKAFKDTYRVNYKGIYVGRIAKNHKDEYQFEEIGYQSLKYCLSLPSFITLHEAEQEANKVITRQQNDRRDKVESAIKSITAVGRDFILKFMDQPVLHKMLTPIEKRIAKHFVIYQLLEKEVSDDKHKVISYYVDSSIKRKILDIFEKTQPEPVEEL